MYRTALRTAPRRIASSRPLVNTSRRFINTAPPTQKSRSWKSSLGRWGLAGAGIYWYNTSPIFKGIEGDALILGETTEGAIQSVNESLHNIQESDQPTLDAIVAEKRLREVQQAEANKKSESQFEQVASAEDEAPEGGEGGLSGLEEEAGQQGAFNPETGEINWDCPCLGGMADGPCGPEFKAAFSCFVYSTEEPKGVECIDKFKGMQDCFRAHPEMYGSELEDDEEELEEEIRAQEAARTEVGSDKSSTTQKVEEKETDSPAKSAPKKSAPDSRPAAGQEVTSSKEAVSQTSQEIKKPAAESEPKQAKPEAVESDEVLPKAAYDASK